MNVYLMFLCLLVIDLLFYQTAFSTMSFIALIRMLLVDMAISFITSFLTSRLKAKYETLICFLVILLFGIFAYVELEFKNFIETYYSFKAVADGGFRVSDFVLYFIRNAKLSYYLNFIPAFTYLFVRLRNSVEKVLSKVYLYVSLGSAFALFLSFVFAEAPLREAVRMQDNFDTIIAHTGINSFFFEDISSIFIKHDDSLVISVDETEEEIEETVEEEISYKRSFDDSKWKKDYEEETNETIKTIDAYLMNRKIEDKNEMTGIYEGYNFIYFLVESMDYCAIDEVLTPTIWKMMKEGYFFSNHYTPVFSCGTGDSEFVAMTSFMSYGSSCTVYSVTENDLSPSLAGLFKNAGYSTYEFHNWDDTFYKRSRLSSAYGVDTYMDVNDLDFKLVNGWQSDSLLAEKSIPYFINDDRFFVFYVTSTMHWPYDVHSYYGDLYLDEINEVHPDYPIELKRFISKTMEFDKMLKTLMDELEKAGKLDNTVFCFWPDHHPFNLSSNIITKYSTFIDRTVEYGYYRSPLIIYNAALRGEENKAVCSTFDHLPTIANMFNLNYDPRLYVGSDIFNDECTVIMSNGDWINNDGIHKNASDRFIPFDENNVPSEEEIEKITAEVKDLIKVGRAIVSRDYFSLRGYLIDPIIKE